jgi:SAM-dependent methyltransferase
METSALFTDLQAINARPAVFSHMTVAELWTDPHISERMLRYHLDGSVAISSDTTQFIDAATDWMTATFRLGPGMRVLDLGCGPGLYTSRLAGTGADITGVDFSSRSIAYARESADRAGLRVTYANEDYLAFEAGGRFDLVTMIMRDYCAMAPEQRLAMLGKIRRWIEPAGTFLFDVDAIAALADRTEVAEYAPAPAGGFWSTAPYFEFHNACVYPAEAVALDKHTIVEAGRTRSIYIWTQFLGPDTLAAELGVAGLRIAELLGDVAGRPYDPDSRRFAVVARP